LRWISPNLSIGGDIGSARRRCARRATVKDLDAGTEAEDVDKKATAATAYDFLKNLDESEKGIVAGSVTNLAIILQYDPRFTGCFQHNEFTKEDVCRKPIRSKAAPISRRA
jgi:hypothetical protein